MAVTFVTTVKITWCAEKSLILCHRNEQRTSKMLAPADYPVDLVIREFNDTRMNPHLPVCEIQGLHESGLSTDEDGETIFDHDDPEIPFGWRVIEADDMSLFFPEEIL